MMNLVDRKNCNQENIKRLNLRTQNFLFNVGRLSGRQRCQFVAHRRPEDLPPLQPFLQSSLMCFCSYSFISFTVKSWYD